MVAVSCVRFVDAKKVGRFTTPCFICGGKSRRRIDLTLKSGEGDVVDWKYKKTSLCWSVSSFSEHVDRWSRKKSLGLATPPYRGCWSSVFKTLDIPSGAAKVRHKRDADTHCEHCGKSPAEGGVLIACKVIGGIARHSVCFDCLVVLLDEVVA